MMMRWKGVLALSEGKANYVAAEKLNAVTSLVRQ